MMGGGGDGARKINPIYDSEDDDEDEETCHDASGARWKLITPPAGGKPYWCNTATQEVQWTKPDGSGDGLWEKVVPEDGSNLYWYNTETRETSWTNPNSSPEVAPAHAHQEASEFDSDGSLEGFGGFQDESHVTPSLLAAAYGDTVEAALARIEAEDPKIAAQFKQCTTGDKTLPPETLEIYERQIPDSVGVLYGGLRQAEAQLASLKANPIRALGPAGTKAKAVQKKRVADLTKEIADYTAKMEHCRDVFCNVLKIPLDTAEANLPTLTKSMAVAATAATTSMQRELGKLWLINQTAAASGNKKLQQLVKKKLNTALGKYDAARNELTGVVVPLVLGDVAKYQAEYDVILATGGDGGGAVSDEVLDGLEELIASIVPLTEAEAETMTTDPRAPDHFHPAYLVYTRLLASETSPVLYRRICVIIDVTGCNAIAVPGGIKGEARIIFKTLTGYNGDFSKCRDVSRITIVVATMRDLLLIALALEQDEMIRTIRGKFRFSRGYDPVPIGGYRDTQYQVFILIDGIWRYAEVQINLHPFMMLKNQKNAGHAAFNKARAIAAYSDATLRFTGGPSVELWTKVAQGMLMYVSLDGSELSSANMAGFLSAAFSPKCRLRVLSFVLCSVNRLSAEKDAGFPRKLIAQAAQSFDNVKLVLRSDSAESTDSSKKVELGRRSSMKRKDGSSGVDWGSAEDMQTIVDNAASAGNAESVFSTLTADAIELFCPPALTPADVVQVLSADVADLDLVNRGIVDSDALWLRLFLCFKDSVSTLNLHQNSIGDASAAAIGQGLAINKTLVALTLSKNNIGDAGAAAIGQGLATNSSLVTLNLDSNNIGAAGTAAIGQGLATNATLVTLNGFDLRTLSVESLDLSNKDIRDNTALAIGCALATNKTLVTLALRENSIGDAGAAAIVQGLATNKSLVTLDLSHNNIGAIGVAAIGQGLAINKTLVTLNGFDLRTLSVEALDLSSKDIDDDTALAIGCALATNKTLATLKLNSNSIGAAGAAAIVQGLATNTSLATLDLERNSIGAAGAAAIGQGLATNLSLVTLDLKRNRIGATGAAAIGQALATNTTLATLDLCENSIGDAGAAAIGQGLATNTSLVTLDLHFNGIGDAGAAAIAQALATNKSLATLSLDGNSIGVAGAAAIGQGLATNTSLVNLNLERNKIGATGAAAIGQALATNTSLKTLDLNFGNSIGAAGATAIGQGLATNTSLATLSLRENSIGDAGAAAIGQGLATNKSLVTLTLYDNNIGDAGAAAIGQGLATNTSLKNLYLQYHGCCGPWISSSAKAALKAAAPNVAISY